MGTAFLHKGGIPADEVDAEFMSRLVQRMRDPDAPVPGNPSRHQRDGGHGHALVDDRDPVFLLDLIAGGDKTACG